MDSDIEARFREANKLMDQKHGVKTKEESWNNEEVSKTKEKQTAEEYEKEGGKSLGEEQDERIKEFMKSDVDDKPGYFVGNFDIDKFGAPKDD